MIKTRTETINYVTYCAYCGKVLKDESNAAYHIWPEQPAVCGCEKAKEELRLYDEIMKLYNEPMHETIVEKKVEIYRNELLGQTAKSETYATGCCSSDVAQCIFTAEPYTSTSIYNDSKATSVNDDDTLFKEALFNARKYVASHQAYTSNVDNSPVDVHYVKSLDDIKSPLKPGDIAVVFEK